MNAAAESSSRVAAAAWDWRGAPARAASRESARIRRVVFGITFALVVAGLFAWRGYRVPASLVVTAFASFVGAVTAVVVLAPVFFLVVTPLGLWKRRASDPLKRTFDRAAPTYWSPHDRPANHRRQF